MFIIHPTVRVGLSLLLASSALAPLGAASAAFPEKRITMVVPFPAGGASDLAARILSEPLARVLGQPVVVDNVGGGAGVIVAAKVVRADKDGYTVMLGSVNETVLGPITNPSVQYKFTDFAPLAKVGSSAFMVIGRKGLEANNIDELIALARKSPGTLSFGSTGLGSYQQIVMESVQQLSGTSMLHVPYRGGSPMLADVLGGQIDLGVALPTMVLPQINDGRIKTFGFTGRGRDAAAPQIPSINEGKSFDSIDFVFWFGIFAPAGVPDDVRKSWATAMTTVLAEPAVSKKLAENGLSIPAEAEQAAFASFIKDEDVKLRAVADKVKFY